MKLTGLETYGGSDAARQMGTEQGVTLLETMIALVILMVAGLGVLPAFTSSIRNDSLGNGRALAISIAQQQMEQLRTAQFTDSVLNVTPTPLTSDIVSNGLSYRVTKTVTGSNNDANGNPTLKAVTIRVDPTNPAGFPVILQTIRTATTKGTH